MPTLVPQPRDENSYIEVRGRRFTSGNQIFRKLYQLYANVRPAKTIRFSDTLRYDHVDLVVIREVGLFFGSAKAERMPEYRGSVHGRGVLESDDSVVCKKRITRHASQVLLFDERFHLH